MLNFSFEFYIDAYIVNYVKTKRTEALHNKCCGKQDMSGSYDNLLLAFVSPFAIKPTISLTSIKFVISTHDFHVDCFLFTISISDSFSFVANNIIDCGGIFTGI